VHWTLGVAGGLSILEQGPSKASSMSSEEGESSFQSGLSIHEQKPSMDSSTTSERSYSSPPLPGSFWGQGDLNPVLNEDMSLLTVSPAMNHRSIQESIRPVRTGPFFLVPYSQNFNFVGQQSIIHRLRQFSDPSNGARNKIALYGLGGTGKSQIALAHAYWYRLNYPGNSIFWVQASSPDQLRDSLELIAAHCRISNPEDASATILDRVRRWLSDESNGHWLMVVNNADHIDTFLRPMEDSQPDRSGSANKSPLSIALGHYLPAPAHGKILYTTNNKFAGETLAAPEYHLEVKPMNKCDACVLLRRLLNDEESSSGDEEKNRGTYSDQELEVLAQHLDFLPLALAQAAAFMRQNTLTVKEYLQLILDDGSALMNLLEHDF
jgi:hypothetical protein